MNPDSEIVTRRIKQCLENIREKEPGLRAYREVQTSRALSEARLLDKAPSDQQGPLHGIPYAVKEVFDAEGALCEWGSEVYRGRRAQTDSEVVKRLQDAGAVLTGITTSSEFALSTAPATTNPFDIDRTPGASSSGSAAAVGAGLVPFAIGSQTIGSCIRPAAYCGCYGFKPTIGSVSLDGAMPLAETLDTCGLFASSLKSIANAFAVLRNDSPKADQGASESRTSNKIVVVSPWFEEQVSQNVVQRISGAADTFQKAGYAVSHASLSALVAEEEERCLMTILCREFSTHHRKAIEASDRFVSERIRAFLNRGINTSDTDYRAALEMRQAMIAEVESLLSEDEIILTCATLDVAPFRTQGTGSRAPQRLWALLGMPCISIPIGTVDGLPIAIQLVGRQGSDNVVLAAAQCLETTIDH